MSSDTLQLLMDTAIADTDQLRRNDALGDVFSTPRDVDFLLIATDAETANVVASFLSEYRYGKTRLEPQADGTTRILVTLRMPIEQNIILAVSGFMACVSKLYKVAYDGWGCEVQRAAPAWPNDADGDVLRKLAAHNFDFTKTYTVDFNVEFERWPPHPDALAALRARYEDVEVYPPDESRDGDVQIRIKHQLTYEFAMETQREVTALMRSFGGKCDTWGVLGP